VRVDEHDRRFESQLELGVEDLLQLVGVVLLVDSAVAAFLPEVKRWEVLKIYIPAYAVFQGPML
jgi:hypothetical protein